jgi:hypothetical protein
MNNEELDASELPEHQISSAEGSFNPRVALTGAAFAAILGLVAALAVTALIGVEWPVRLVMAFHAALSFGILGAWIAASFGADDEDDTASIHSLPVIVPIPIVSSQGSARDPRTAA